MQEGPGKSASSVTEPAAEQSGKADAQQAIAGRVNESGFLKERSSSSRRRTSSKGSASRSTSRASAIPEVSSGPGDQNVKEESVGGSSKAAVEDAPQPLSTRPEPSIGTATTSPHVDEAKKDERAAEPGAMSSGPLSDQMQIRITMPSASAAHMVLQGPSESPLHACLAGTSSMLCLVLAILFFLLSLDVLSSAFKLVSGRAAGRALTNSRLLRNPVVALMIGVLVTVMVQSSSSSTSITVSMVGSNLIQVRDAVPIIMGANVGTSVTNTMISLMHIKRRDEFRRGFAAATVHDVFNWLTVLVLLPCEVAFNLLEKLSGSFVQVIDKGQRLESRNYLNALTKPFIKLIVQLDSKVIDDVAMGKETNSTILKQCCERNSSHCIAKCTALFNWINMSDTATGICCFVLAVVVILLCFYVMVKVLTRLTQSHLVKVLTVCVNREYSFPTSMLIGYLSLMLGCLITFVFQSSSAFTSALLPFAALGMLDLSRIYPLTLGSNVGTTATGLVAALAGSPVKRRHALQIALCHTLFNVIGILLFYPLPFLRLPLFIARRLGETGAKYRWFVLLYLLLSFVLIPIAALLLSLLGDLPFSIIMVAVVLVGVSTMFINVLQEKWPGLLPLFLQNWDFLPLWMHSLAPMDRFFKRRLERVPFCEVFLNEMSYSAVHDGDLGGNAIDI